MDLVKRRTRWKKCSFRSECRARSNRRYLDRLFRADWDVLVIKKDQLTGELKWSTEPR